ncbi:Co/Zn/Cd cation transporter-like protein [Gigaspora margarita]|uniref:Co/Zn/Cd cation transporter-like protein n=1 Tax=Gigaspora margarita TaxID=4874 RepID=A0A8H4AUT1_GIGMA|nr:Co/Zn/Cd cation transporter-like protein [Gigaspora margarita]
MAILSTPFTRPQLVNLALISSIITILLNIAEGILSMFFGNQTNSVSLIIFGIGSFVEVTSSILVLWRFSTELHQDTSVISVTNKDKYIDKERKATLGIGSLFIVLALGTFLHAIISLTQKSHPDDTMAGIIISSISIVIMLVIYFCKRYLAVNLNSFTMASEAQCSFACIKITLILFCSSLIYILWKKGWWVDSVAALIFSTFFSKEGVEMIYWANSENFDGRCNANIDEKVDDVISDDESSGSGGGQIHVIGEIEVERVVEKMQQEETRGVETKWWGNNGTDVDLENGTRNVKNDYENSMKPLTIAVELRYQQGTLH